VTRTHTPRRNSTPRRQRHLAVIELPDEISAFQAYRLLQYHGVSPENLAIVGEGYSSPDRIGLLRPFQIARRKASKRLIQCGSIGAVMGFFSAAWMSFQPHHLNQLTLLHAQIHSEVQQFPNGLLWLLLPMVSGLLCGLAGAIVGGCLGFFGEGTAAGIYRHRLRQGHYLLMIEGSEKLVRWCQEVLSQYSNSRLY
jgi:hypothetical protein